MSETKAAETDKPSVLFVCIHNAGRSQMAAGFARHYGGQHLVVRSAGSDPATTVNPVAVAAMAEVGIDIAGQTPTRLDYDTAYATDVIITMGCGDACPRLPRANATRTGNSTTPPGRASTSSARSATTSTSGYGPWWPSCCPSRPCRDPACRRRRRLDRWIGHPDAYVASLRPRHGAGR